jgi:hypothetical protein
MTAGGIIDNAFGCPVKQVERPCRVLDARRASCRQDPSHRQRWLPVTLKMRTG